MILKVNFDKDTENVIQKLKHTLCVQSADEHMPLALATRMQVSQNQENYKRDQSIYYNVGVITSSRFPNITDTLKVGWTDISASFLAMKKHICTSKLQNHLKKLLQ